MENKNTSPAKLLVFDLNGTFYNKHSSEEFFKFILTKNPARVKYFFKMAYYRLLKALNQINHTEFKENFFDYLNNIPPDEVEALADEFWDREFPKNFNPELKAHFDRLKSSGTQLVCITGGFECYVKPLFEKHYPIDYFSGTRTEYVGGTHTIVGEAYKKEEKIKRLDEHYGKNGYKILETYSDSEEALFKVSEKSFMIKKGKIVPYQPKK